MWFRKGWSSTQSKTVEGGVADILGGSIMLRQGPPKSEITFVKQNRKWIHIHRSRFGVALAQNVEVIDVSSKIGGLWPGFENSQFLFGLFRGTPPKYGTTFVKKHLILFHNVVCEFPGARRNITQKSHFSTLRKRKKGHAETHCVPQAQSSVQGPVTASRVNSSGPASPITHRTPFFGGNLYRGTSLIRTPFPP